MYCNFCGTEFTGEDRPQLSESGRCWDCQENVVTCVHCEREVSIDRMFSEDACVNCVFQCRSCGITRTNAELASCEIREGCMYSNSACSSCMIRCTTCDRTMCGGHSYYCESYCGGEDRSGNNRTFMCHDHYIRCNRCGGYRCLNCGANHDAVCERARSYRDWYEYRPDPLFRPNASELDNPYGHLGIELEFESNPGEGHIADVMEKVREYTDLVYFHGDGSLRRGIEMVSHPLSFTFHNEEFDWEHVLEMAREGLHIERSCGMHVHVSRCNLTEEHEDRLLLLLQRFRSPLEAVAERSGSSWAAWNVGDDFVVTDVSAKRSAKSGRYRAINFSNRDTLEFRLFSGTDDPDTVKTRLDVVDSLVKTAMSDDVLPDAWDHFMEVLTRDESRNKIATLL